MSDGNEGSNNPESLLSFILLSRPYQMESSFSFGLLLFFLSHSSVLLLC